MKAFSAALFLLATLVAINCHSQSATKAQLKNLTGDWLGEFTFEESRNTIMMAMSLSENTGKKGKGILNFPEFFNSSNSIEVKLENSQVLFNELEMTQGYEMDLNGKYLLSYVSADSIYGNYTDGDMTVTGEFWMKRKSKLEKSQLDKFERIQTASLAYYGLSLVKELQQSESSKDILEQVGKRQTKESDSFNQFTIIGRMQVNTVEVPIIIYYLKPEFMKFEFQIQNVTFYSVINQKEKWEYDPVNDKLKITPHEEQAKSEDIFSFRGSSYLSNLEDGYSIKSVKRSQLDSLSTYRIVMGKEEARITYFIDDQTLDIVRIDKDQTSEYRLKYKTIKGQRVPTVFLNIEANQKIRMDFEQIDFDSSVEEELFDIPAELLAKQKKEERAKDEEFYELGLQYLESEDYPKAIEHFTKAIELNSDITRYYQKRGEAKVSNGDYYGSIGDYTRAIELTPRSAVLYNLLATVKYKLKDYRNALPDYTKAIQLDSNYLQAYYNRAYTYANLDDIDNSIQDFRTLCRKDSTNANYFLNLGIMLAQNESYTEAINAYNYSLLLNGENATTYNYKGVSQFNLENYEEAASAFKYAIKYDSTSGTKFNNLGNTFLNLEKYDSAILSYQNALSIDAENDDYYNNMGKAYYYDESYKAAESFYSKAIAINGQDASYFDNRAKAKEALQDFTGAIEDYNISIDLYSTDPAIYYLRGLLKIGIHDYYDGCRDLRKSAEMGYEGATEAIKEKCTD
ncbi:MAG: tetratricopeptide repeat protein [Reichenbachiella sp.]|uniref:tetratricopeptide repeat protein n=1 Tax=Reichenbachiella sp. TaxID=2184521 RepID=UPI003265AF70